MTGFELKLWRLGQSWSQEKAARELGVSLKTYGNWETRGRKDVSKLVELAVDGISYAQAWREAAIKLRGAVPGHKNQS